MTACRSIRIACVFACAVGTLISAACDKTTPSPVGPSDPSSNSSGSWELSGLAIGEDGRPISNAPVSVGVGRPSEPVRTDDSGRYSAKFDARQGGYVYGSTAAVYLDAGGDYENETRLFRPVGSNSLQTLNFFPRRITWIQAEEPVSVTVEPGDAPCFNNVQDGAGPGPVYLCRTVRMIVPAAGVLTADAESVGFGSRPKIEMEGPGDLDCCYLGNPISMSVEAGMEVKIRVEILEGSPRQTFALTARIR